MVALGVFSRHLRRGLLFLLFLNLLLTVVREIFDLMGYVWSPIAADFLNVVFCIFAVFGVVQLRVRFLYVYFVWCFLWIAWNAFCVCFYAEVGVLRNDDRRLINWGAGGDGSWWLRNTPGCRRSYNATSATVEIGECQYLRPPTVEIAEAGAHIALTTLIFILAAVFCCNFPRKRNSEMYSSLPRKRSTPHPHVTVEIGAGQEDAARRQAAAASGAGEIDRTAAGDTSFNRSSDQSSGYLNASYDTGSSSTRKVNGTLNNDLMLFNGAAAPTADVDPRRNQNRPTDHTPPRPLQNYRRNSNRRRSSGGSTSVQRRAREKSRERAQTVSDLPTISGARPHLIQQNPIADEPPEVADVIRTTSARHSQRMARPVQRLEDLLVGSQTANDDRNIQATVVNGFDDTQQSVDYDEWNDEGEDDMPEYERDSRVFNGGLPNQQTGGDPRGSNAARRSVISFDPKSDSDTLLRFHEHLARSQETITSRASAHPHHRGGNTAAMNGQRHHPQEDDYGRSQPPDVISFDSGLPSSVSHAGGSDDDPRLSRDSQVLNGYHHQNQQQQRPIGYEPAFMMSYEPEGSQDEPIYKPSFLRSSTSGHGYSPSKFRYHHPHNQTQSTFLQPPRGAPPPPPTTNGYDSGVILKAFDESQYVQPNSAKDKLARSSHGKMSSTKSVQRPTMGQDSVSESSSNETSHDGLAIPRINNSSLLV